MDIPFTENKRIRKGDLNFEKLDYVLTVFVDAVNHYIQGAHLVLLGNISAVMDRFIVYKILSNVLPHLFLTANP